MNDVQADERSIQLAWQDIEDHHYADEERCVSVLGAALNQHTQINDLAQRDAVELINAVRQHGTHSSIEAFLHEYPLNSAEGAALMCLAEAIIRIPDDTIAKQLLKDKLNTADWEKHLQHSESFWVNRSSWALNIGSKLVNERFQYKGVSEFLQRLINKYSEPIVLSAVRQAVSVMSRQFVFAEQIQTAIRKTKAPNSRFSFDMLGEAAITQKDADDYFQAYYEAISYLGQSTQDTALADTMDAPSISIKLSALHPRYEYRQRQAVLGALNDKLHQLLQHAISSNVPVTIDAEESNRLSLSLEIFQQQFYYASGQAWPFFGLAVQAYGKRAQAVLHWLRALAIQHGRIPVRLVKGAYWDSEIKWAQQQAKTHYPVFTRKAATDLSYLHGACYLLENCEHFYPQFATHNAHTVAFVRTFARRMLGTSGDQHSRYEFQRLHGMGEALYTELLHRDPQLRCRVYAPIGAHKELLPYLVRRLLENGANSSFIHLLNDDRIPAEQLAQHPLQQLSPTLEELPPIAAPQAVFSERRATVGLSLESTQEEMQLQRELAPYRTAQWHAHPIIDGHHVESTAHDVFCAYQTDEPLGTATDANPTDVTRAFDVTDKASLRWRETDVKQRAAMVYRFVERMHDHKYELIALCCREAGKTIPDSYADWQEACDLANFYAAQALQLFSSGESFSSVSGESNSGFYKGRGTFVCISPWNFPLAIFTGQVTAALLSGNCAIAKPAESTSLCAFRICELLQEAGIPADVLQFLPGEGATIGDALCSNPSLSGVVFTGSTHTAKRIQINLANKHAGIVPLIAETGGQNAMIVDSSAHPEQLVTDIIQSAFNSAGQRCSSLRVLYLPDSSYDHVMQLLCGAMQELQLGDPWDLASDIGPVINQTAYDALHRYLETARAAGQILYQTPLPSGLNATTMRFVPPTLLSINSLEELRDEHFGPIVHIIRYRDDAMAAVLEQVQRCPFGLTLGIHTRNDRLAHSLAHQLRVGNIYINRNMIGATVESQPFGGQGLSGTGPKAGGKNYLRGFCTEVTISNNTSAIGGNLHLLGGEAE